MSVDTSDISREPLQNDVATTLGLYKAWRVTGVGSDGTVMYFDAINWRKQFDYTGRDDGQPVYQGIAVRGSGDGDSVWVLLEYTYDANNRVTDIKIAYDSWTNRAGATYA